MKTNQGKQKAKIPHPYTVPEKFFSEFKTEVLNRVENQPIKNSRILPLAKKALRYAAVAVFVFFAVKGMVYTFQKKSPDLKNTDAEIDAIYSQISEDDLTNFITDESNVELTEILDF